VLVMGVAGSGKSLIGRKVAEALGCRFADADDFHPAANIEKMSHGIPLTDADREPWLRAMRDAVLQWSAAGECVVLACSALKRRYREQLSGGTDLKVVYLKGTFDVIHARLRERQDHFMKPEMLASQFADLEEPSECIVADVSGPPEEMAAEIARRLST